MIRTRLQVLLGGAHTVYSYTHTAGVDHSNITSYLVITRPDALPVAYRTLDVAESFDRLDAIKIFDRDASRGAAALLYNLEPIGAMHKDVALGIAFELALRVCNQRGEAILSIDEFAAAQNNGPDTEPNT